MMKEILQKLTSKASLLVCLLATSLTVSCLAQSGDLYLGLSGGGGFAGFLGSPWVGERHEAQLGYQGGLFLSSDPTHRFSWRISTDYTRAGALHQVLQRDDYYDVTEHFVSTRLHYLSLGATLRLRLVGAFYVGLGQHLGYLVGSDIVLNGLGNEQEALIYTANDFATLTTFSAIEIGVDMAIGPRWRGGFNLRYTLSPINNLRDEVQAGQERLCIMPYTAFLMFNVAYRMGAE